MDLQQHLNIEPPLSQGHYIESFRKFDLLAPDEPWSRIVMPTLKNVVSTETIDQMKVHEERVFDLITVLLENQPESMKVMG
eukprot:gene30380-37584_t